MALAKPDPDDVVDFPHDIPNAKVVAMKGRHGTLLYVSVREKFTKPDGRVISHIKHLGKIVDGRYYPMEEYRRHFNRNGKPIESEQDDTEPRRSYKRRVSLEHDPRRKYPSPKTLKGFPKRGHSRARICKIGPVLYVVESTYSYDENGKSKENRVYLGRVINDNEFVTIEQYRQMVAGPGKSRTIRTRAKRSSGE